MTCDRLEDALVICGEANCRLFLLEFDPGGSMSQSLANLGRERRFRNTVGREKETTQRRTFTEREMNEYTWSETETNTERRDELTHSRREMNENTRGRERERESTFLCGRFLTQSAGKATPRFDAKDKIRPPRNFLRELGGAKIYRLRGPPP